MMKNKKKKKEIKKEKKAKVFKEKQGYIQLPLARVKKIMKTDKEVRLISNEASVLVSKATELFLEYITEEAYKRTKADKRKLIQYKDFTTVINDIEILDFLTDVIPDKKISTTQITKPT